MINIMKTKTLICLSLLLLCLISCGNTQDKRNYTVQETQTYKDGELLVKFREGTDILGAKSVHRSVSASIKKRFRSIGVEQVALPAGHSVIDAVKVYKSDPRVEYAEPNYIVKKAIFPNDSSFYLQWGFHNTGQVVNGITGTPGADINAPEAWDIHTGTGTVVVAVIDTGADYSHPDISAHIWTNPFEIPDNGIDDDQNGFVDDIRGWNFAYGNNDPMDDDVDGHGTHVSGVIGAVGNNTLGISGISWNVRIMPLKFLDNNGEGAISDVIDAIDYAVKMGAKVINASYTYPQSCSGATPSITEKNAIQMAGHEGVLFVAAAGNFGCDNDRYPFYPSSHKLDNIISTTASNQYDEFPSWSNYGINSVHVAAPGEDIYSTVPTWLGSYNYMSGTSMATPFVSGLAALIMSYRTDFSLSHVKETIIGSVDAKPEFLGKTISGGRINAFNALSSPGRPVRPTGLSASLISELQINLSWIDNSSLEEGFSIEKKTGQNGTYNPLNAQLPADTTDYTDTSVNTTEGTAYYYRIRAFNSEGESSYSNEAVVVIPPAAPSNLKASAVSDSGINLSWTDNSSLEEGFSIERKTGAGGSFVITASAPQNATTYHDTGLNDSETYYYRVRAYNSTAGFSAYSNEAGASTSSSSCFIAAAAYGSSLDPHVQVLRSFRDTYLLSDFILRIAGMEWRVDNSPGRSFVALYYRHSPPAAEYIRHHPLAKSVIRCFLTPVVYGIIYPWISVPVMGGFFFVLFLFIKRTVKKPVKMDIHLDIRKII
jgi:subtilisin family serine protease